MFQKENGVHTQYQFTCQRMQCPQVSGYMVTEAHTYFETHFFFTSFKRISHFFKMKNLKLMLKSMLFNDCSCSKIVLKFTSLFLFLFSFLLFSYNKTWLGVGKHGLG